MEPGAGPGPPAAGAATLGQAGEFGLIARIVERLTPGPAVLIGPGDDAAVLRARDGRVVATTDLLVDGVHFDRSWSSAADVGVKAAAQNLADVAAMGAVATGLLAGLAAPGELPLRWAEDLAGGLHAEAVRAGAALVGGDVVASDRLTIAVTALGDLQGRAPVTRSGARVGDLVVLAGRAGWAAAGLAVLRAGLAEDPQLAELADAHRRPRVPYPAAVRLAASGATAMIDVSDGLVADLGHVADRSGVGIELDAERLPLAGPLAVAGRRLGRDPLGWVAAGGDDHPFAATLPPAAAAVAAAELRALPEPCPLAVIGRVVEGRGVHWQGRPPSAAAGHEHFRAGG